jgi:hypothetical protein
MSRARWPSVARRFASETVSGGPRREGDNVTIAVALGSASTEPLVVSDAEMLSCVMLPSVDQLTEISRPFATVGADVSTFFQSCCAHPGPLVFGCADDRTAPKAERGAESPLPRRSAGGGGKTLQHPSRIFSASRM